MRRQLRSTQTGKIVGIVDDAETSPFEGAAGDVLAGLRNEVGDAETVKIVMRDGWSNGWLYFDDARP